MILWRLQLQNVATIKRNDGRNGAVVVTSKTRRRWIAVALETSGAKVEQILAEHRHRLLGEFSTERKAKAAGERFLMEWAKGTDSIADTNCDCHIEGRAA